MNLPCPKNFLIRTKNTSQQSRFRDPNLRCENIRDAFKVPDFADVSGLSILLLDDVSTTGSTLHEAALTLYRNGARHVAGIAAASGRTDERVKRAV
jgi:predicted amidophosphoribosyltransferase